jgi:hypothetical protein
MVAEEEKEHFDPSTRRLNGHKYTDNLEMSSEIMAMCEGMGLGKKSRKRPIPEEGFFGGFKILFLKR